MKTYHITGMKCDGCATTVTEKLSSVRGVKEVKVDLEKQVVSIEGNPFKWSLKFALRGTKFQLGNEVK